MGRPGRIGVLVAAAALLVAGCLIGAVLIHDASDHGRSDGQAALAGITLPDGWTRSRVLFREIRPDGGYPTTWSLEITAPGTAAATGPPFVDAMRAAGWQQCGDGVTCWVKRPYRIAVTVHERAGTTVYAIAMRTLAVD